MLKMWTSKYRGSVRGRCLPALLANAFLCGRWLFSQYSLRQKGDQEDI